MPGDKKQRGQRAKRTSSFPILAKPVPKILLCNEIIAILDTMRYDSNNSNTLKDIMMDLDGAVTNRARSKSINGKRKSNQSSFRKGKSENVPVVSTSPKRSEQRQQIPIFSQNLDKRSSESSLFSGETNNSTIEKGETKTIQLDKVLNESSESSIFSAESSIFSGTSSIHESTVVSAESKDGIELMANDGDMKIMHVLGNNTKNLPQKIVLNQPTPVHFAIFSTNYHAMCQSEANGHRIGHLSNESNPIDSISLLEKFEVLDEETAMRNELRKSSAEIASLEHEQGSIRNRLNGAKCNYGKCVYADCQKEWDINVFLNEEDGSTNQISDQTRSQLQETRGNYFYATFDDTRLSSTFEWLCAPNVKKVGNQINGHDYLDIKESYANASTVRHVAIYSGIQEISCFVGSDDGCANIEGNLPSRLSSRLINEGIRTNNIRYLSCGPENSYYAELKSGDCLWGISGDDKFDDILAHIDVHRVAFGPFHTRNGELETSWIVISKNGRVAWRNIPSGLHKILKERKPDMAVPSEVSIGFEGSYFVKFLDGRYKYCLPSHIAEVCDKIHNEGRRITDVILHTEDSGSYIIRHT